MDRGVRTAHEELGESVHTQPQSNCPTRQQPLWNFLAELEATTEPNAHPARSSLVSEINAAVAASDQAATERDTAAAGSEEHSRATQLANYYTQKVQQLEQAKADTLDCNFDFSPDVMADAGARIATKQQELLPQISTARGRLKEFRDRERASLELVIGFRKAIKSPTASGLIQLLGDRTSELIGQQERNREALEELSAVVEASANVTSNTDADRIVASGLAKLASHLEFQRLLIQHRLESVQLELRS